MSATPDRGMDEIIERSLRGEATEAELDRLAAWRAAPENEQQYRHIERLVAATWTLRHGAVPPRPSASAILARAAERRTPFRRRHPFLRWVPWASAAALITLAITRVAMRNGDAWAPAEIVTGASELATVKLADGTVVRLAPSSRLHVEQNRPREVTLEGRAFFAVSKRDNQPFRVHTRSATANVLGTRFELATHDAGVRLVVLEGRVALDAPQNEVVVGAGEESDVEDGHALPPSRSGADPQTFAWLGRFMAFQATPLADAAREIERLYPVRIVIADSALARTTLTATFTDQTVDAVMSVVCAVLSAQCSNGDGTITVSR